MEFSDAGGPRTRPADARLSLPRPSRLAGGGFQRYRQFRATVWHESMRLASCRRILSDDHAFGFVLNAIESRRVELLGRRLWRGMDPEIVFNYAFRWRYRPQLREVYGGARLVEGFYQHFTFGGVKGEAASNHLERIAAASGAAAGILDGAVRGGRGTEWIEKRVPGIVRALGVDSLLTVPIALPWARPALPVDEDDLRRALSRVSRARRGEFGGVDPDEAEGGEGVRAEYERLLAGGGAAGGGGGGGGGGGAAGGTGGIFVPERTDVDETAIYDADLIGGLMRRFRRWRSGWSEEHRAAGDEFDAEAYAEGSRKPFFADSRRPAGEGVALLLDHSSSVAAVQLEYKKATLALCEALSRLGVGFSVYAFSAAGRSVACWAVKSDSEVWGSTCAKRLAQIPANGPTPLAEVYGRIRRLVASAGKGRRPGTLLTLTDGEPSDPDAVRSAVSSFRALGIGMVALGLGPDAARAAAIASNLKKLGYERALAVSRLEDIPGKVLGILGGD